MFFSSCSDAPTSVGKDIVSSDLVGVNRIDSDSLSQSSSFYKNVPHTGLSSSILIGKSENVQASTLISFYMTLPDTIASDIVAGNITVISASIGFTKSYVFGDTLSNLDFNGYEITNGWTSLGFTSDSLSQLTYNSTNLVTNKVFTDTTLTFNIDNQLANAWITNAAVTDSVYNKGIYLEPTSSSQKIVGYQSEYYSNGYPPVLSIVIQKANTYIDTLDFSTYGDVSVVTGNAPNVSPQKIVVQGGLAYRGKLKFDINKVPKNVVINNAELVLKLDSTESEIGSSTNTLVVLRALGDTTNNTYDSTQAVIMTKNGNTISGNVTSYVQQLLNSGDNYGFILAAEDEIGTADLFSIYGSNYSVRSLRPKLTIYYTYKK